MILNRLLVKSASILDTRVGVTGVQGFIGSNAVGDLESKLYELSDPSLSIDVLIHCAAKCDDSVHAFQNNVALDAAVFDICSRRGIMVIYASSNNVYPLEADCSENMPLFANDLYALSKVTGEALLKTGVFRGLRFIVMRIADTFGVGQNHGRLFRSIADSVRFRTPLALYGQGLKTRSYIYIEEVPQIIKHFIQRRDDLQGQVFNVCHSEPASVGEIIKLVSSTAHLPMQTIATAETANTRTMLNQRLAASGYVFQFTLNQALRRFVARLVSP